MNTPPEAVDKLVAELQGRSAQCCAQGFYSEISGCILDKGHDGAHEYGTLARAPTRLDLRAAAALTALSSEVERLTDELKDYKQWAQAWHDAVDYAARMLCLPSQLPSPKEFCRDIQLHQRSAEQRAREMKERCAKVCEDFAEAFRKRRHELADRHGEEAAKLLTAQLAHINDAAAIRNLPEDSPTEKEQGK